MTSAVAEQQLFPGQRSTEEELVRVGGLKQKLCVTWNTWKRPAYKELRRIEKVLLEDALNRQPRTQMQLVTECIAILVQYTSL